MTRQVKIMAILTARPGKAEALRELLDSMVPHCRAEPGNLRWDIWQDQAQPGRYVLDELYQNGAAAIAHCETPHFKNYVAQIGELADRVALTLDPVEVAKNGA